MPLIVLSESRPSPLWSVAQVAGVVLTGVLLVGLLQWPMLTLHILWDMVIPILPAVFLINPMLWRNVCPLGTLNDWTGRRSAPPLGRGLMVSAWVIGVILLGTLVPARRFLFNQDGVALAVTIAVVAALALLVGLQSPRRSGFCNSVCPVLPVEKLYGQAPLLQVPSARCTTCDVCTPAGCIDLAGGKSARQSLRRRSQEWLINPFGIMVAAFPGFILGYFTLENGGPAEAANVYLHVGMWALGSLVVVLGVMSTLRPQVTQALPILGALSAGLYYWYAAPALAEAYGAPVVGPLMVRLLAAGLLLVWLGNAYRSRSTNGGVVAQGG
ncbi:MAG: hypothetical protein SGI84_10025 [Gemmatimonadota bacterium]|nr:hypothetical protein [Gemmatimonadota bacterium]